MCTCKVPAGRAFFNVHSVVKIARSLAVDSDDGQVAEIAAAGEVGFADRTRGAARFGENLFGETVRKMMLANNDLDIHADIAGPAENFDNASGSRDAGARETRQLDFHHGAIEFGKTLARADVIWSSRPA